MTATAAKATRFRKHCVMPEPSRVITTLYPRRNLDILAVLDKFDESQMEDEQAEALEILNFREKKFARDKFE